jgi:hypothetical protein
MACGLVGSVWACAVAPPREGTVRVVEESAIIVWDSGSKMQHFIRRATFTAMNTPDFGFKDTPDFGFLVPTPTQPTLGEASDSAFAELEKLIAPRIEKVREIRVMPPIGCGMARKAPPGGSVQVLDEQRVAGYDAAVLEASSATALNDWLKRHGYTTRPDLTTWLSPYVKDGWKLTAFKVARDAKREDIATSAVRMSFSADKPFFPYSEPADQRQGESHGRRLLRVFLLADKRYQGDLGDSKPWPGRTVWAGPVQAEKMQPVADKVSPVVVPASPWLTAFEDDSSPRPGTADLFFTPSATQEEVYPKPIVYPEPYDIGGWLCLAVLVMLVISPIIVRMLRKHTPATPPPLTSSGP